MRAAIREILKTVALALVLFMVLQTVIHNYRVEGFSMEPTLNDGQYIVVNKTTYWFDNPQRGDIVVFDTPRLNHGIIHRIVGLPGELIKIEDGVLYVNGERKEEPYIQGNSKSVSPGKIPEDSYFIIGDNRGAASWDIVSEEEIIGKAWLCYWPVNEWGLVSNYSWESQSHR